MVRTYRGAPRLIRGRGYRSLRGQPMSAVVPIVVVVSSSLKSVDRLLFLLGIKTHPVPIEGASATLTSIAKRFVRGLGICFLPSGRTIRVTLLAWVRGGGVRGVGRVAIPNIRIPKFVPMLHKSFPDHVAIVFGQHRNSGWYFCDVGVLMTSR